MLTWYASPFTLFKLYGIRENKEPDKSIRKERTCKNNKLHLGKFDKHNNVIHTISYRTLQCGISLNFNRLQAPTPRIM